MIKIHNLNFDVGKFQLRNVSLEILDNEYFVLLGPSGSGKTTLLKCILGIHKIVSGKIFVNEQEVTNLHTENRNIGFLPQNFLLFPNMNVFNNIAYGLKIKNKSKEFIISEIKKIVNDLKISHLLNRQIFSLSGGETQKVALARAIITNPNLLLLDEPYSSIDENYKTDICFEIKDNLKKLNIPVIHITHNLDEAYALADRVGIIINGIINQVGFPKEVFNFPTNENVAKFLGIKNIFDGEIVEIFNNDIVLNFNNIKIVVNKNKDKNYIKNKKIKFCIKPESIKIIKPNEPVRDELKENIFDTKIVEINFYSDTCIMKIDLFNDKILTMKFPIYIFTRYNLSIGKKIKIGLWKTGIISF